MSRLILSLLAALALTAPAAAQVAFRPAVERAIDDVIVPAYAALVDAAAAEAEAMEALCRAPSPPEALMAARARFADLVAAFGRVELYRFGPAREDNRFERIFFWPDRRGRGLRQVQSLLADEDETATDPETLYRKSVAVQGLLALDFVLSGEGNETLMDAQSFRCRYGAAIAATIERNAAAILDGWQGAGGYAALMRAADGNIYRSHGEVAQDLVKAAAEEVQIVRDFKLGNVLGDAPADARPRLAPFWRSNLALTSIDANIDGIAALGAAVATVLPAGEREMRGALAFELSRAKGAIAPLADDPRPLAEIVADPEAHRRLAYARSPLGGTFRILDQRMPAALGLTLGFNSLDGD
ncbi:imelysin family protein [Acuticoccus sp. I52.16.1]|uniref:imelysin family protein n=1 Tax=Acuticoccus sp. I52.16.1 TaxID=2928472 RepID=UPI001FD5F853|nr:imelysin family protein [Acuticoccus sp. I52.16.1]UOM32932.1 imelysin family protein [Acuticoccus sp. I52.16.1]